MRLQLIDLSPACPLPERAEEWLDSLPGPVMFRLAGKDRSRARGLSVLLHGNEPSGFRALHAWLRRRALPAVDVIGLIGAVPAARLAPRFSHRFPPDGRDLNRCFREPFTGPEGELARTALAALGTRELECAVDLHNNSGHNPAYGVGPRRDPATLGLVSLFSRLFVHNQLDLGTFTEALAARVPTVTIECGRFGDPGADRLALEGLTRYLQNETFEHFREAGERCMVMENPVRVHLAASTRVMFRDQPDPNADLTLDPEIDRHNFGTVAAGTRLGWARPGSPWPFEARAADGREISHEYFAVREGALYCIRELIPIMMTTSPVAAKQDCLFYIVETPKVDRTRSSPYIGLHFQ